MLRGVVLGSWSCQHGLLIPLFGTQQAWREVVIGKRYSQLRDSDVPARHGANVQPHCPTDWLLFLGKHTIVCLHIV